MEKTALRLFYVGIFVLVLACLTASNGLAGYNKAGTALPKQKNPGPQACMQIPQPALSITLQNKDMKRLKLAQSYINYMRAQGGDPGVIKSLYRASIRTGVDFELLLLKASLESDMGRFTAAARSSARGVFQYIEPTWLILISRYGDKIGRPDYAQAIKIGSRTGIPYFKGNDKYLRSEILALRHDADVSALIKAYQIIEETDVIRHYKGGKKVSTTDHYIAHMMGLNLAKDFYDLMNKNSILAVARLNKPQMREAAMLNKAFFYDKRRRPLTANLAYVQFQKRVAREVRKIRSIEKYSSKPSCVFADARVN